MMHTANALVVCVLFFCGLEEAVASQHGHCTGNHCFALFQQPDNFLGAQKKCKERDGKLLTFTSTDTVTITTILPIGLTGSYWLDVRSTDRAREEATAGRQNCSSISVSSERNLTVTWEPCRENLEGFLCQYTIDEPCRVLQAGGGAQVKYTAPMGLEAIDSETFPPGTIAVAETTGAKYPDSKHLCFSTQWLRAPWNCEVMRGGCEYICNSTQTCHCPAGQTLHPNNITCTKDPCAECAQQCQKEVDNYVCKCNSGYLLAQDGRSCVDVNECEQDNPCTGEGEECKNTPGGFECTCKDGFEAEDGVCVNVTICESCEHMQCEKFNGVYKCVCRKGFKVSDKDPTKCELECRETDCPAICIPNSDNNKTDMLQCYCPRGYIIDKTYSTPICRDINECENEMQCDHKCENLLGGYRCSCNEGFKLHKEYKCSPIEEEEEEEDGSGSTPPYPTTVSAHPAAVPSYIKTGSILGISMFTMLCVVLLFFLVRNLTKRCRTFELSSLKHQNIDIFYLQQVTTETYKKLSFDKSFKNDSQIL